MANDLHIRALGPFVVERGGTPLPEAIWRSRQERRLLAILIARRGRSTSAERLIEWLWPGADPSVATVTLRSAVSSLRRTLEPQATPRASSRYVITQPGGYAWNTESSASLDVDAFLALSKPPYDGAQLIGRLEQAVALYRGELFEDEPDAPWAIAERERLRERYLASAEALAAAYIGRADYAEAAALSRRALSHSSLCEPLWRLLMRAQMLGGDASGALQSYERYRHALDRELGAVPSAQTQALHAAILRDEFVGQAAPTEASPRPAPVAAQGKAPLAAAVSQAAELVGRDRELAHLRGLVAELRERRGGTVTIVGEAGIGKSRLAAEALREALAGGAQTIALRCTPLERDLPFAALAEALHRLVRVVPDEVLLRLPPSSLAQVADLLPALHERLPGLPEPPAVPPEEHRNRLIGALADLALFMAHDTPLVVLCDDAQWADDATLALAGRLARRAPRHALLIILAYRSEDLTENLALHTLLRTLGREMLLRPMILGRLGDADAASLVSQLGGVAPLDRLTPWIVARAGGNPLFLTVAVQSILEQHRAPSPTEAAAVADEGKQLPDLSGAQPIRDLVLGRFERLPRPARDLAEQIAVIGRPVSLDLIEQLAGPDGLEATQALIDRQILVEGSDGRLGFAHDLVRSIIASVAVSPRRRLLHRRAAQAIAALHGKLPERAAEIAYHFARGGREVDSALLHYAAAAGDHARRVFAYRAALGHYDTALAAADRLGSDAAAPAVRGVFSGRLLTSETLLDWEEVAGTVARYERWAEQQPEPPPALIATRRLILLRALTGDLAGAAELSRQQETVAGQLLPVLVDMVRRTAQVLESPDLSDGPAGGAPAADLLEFQVAPPPPGRPSHELPGLLGPEEAALVLFQVGWAALMQGLVRDAEPCLVRAYELANTTSQATAAVVSALQLAHLHALRGDAPAADQWLTASLETARQAPEATWASIWPRLHQGFLWLLDDRVDVAHQRFELMEEQLSPLPAFQSHRAAVQVGMGLTALAQGQIERAERILLRSLKAPHALYGFVYVAALHGSARLSALRGDVAGARSTLRLATGYSQKRQLLPEYIRTAIEVARVERDFGDAQVALPFLGRAVALAGEAQLYALGVAASGLLHSLAHAS